MLPLGRAGAPLAFEGDALLFVYLMGLARFAMAASAMDRRLRYVFGDLNLKPSFVCSRDCRTVIVPVAKSMLLQCRPRISPRRSPVVAASMTGMYKRL